MSRLMTRVVRLLKFGAVVGAAVGVGRLVMRRRRQADADESSWPTIAETAAQNGQPVGDAPSTEETGELDEDGTDVTSDGDEP